MDGATEAVANAGCDAALIAVDADVGGEQDEQQNRKCSEGHVEEAAQRVRAKGRSDICFRFARLVGGIGFVHEMTDRHLVTWPD